MTVILLAKVYINLIDQKEPLFDFKNQNIEKDKDKVENIKISKYCKKVIEPTENEFKLHKEYLKNSLKKNYFN